MTKITLKKLQKLLRLHIQLANSYCVQHAEIIHVRMTNAKSEWLKFSLFNFGINVRMLWS
jgi:hypothetical protein